MTPAVNPELPSIDARRQLLESRRAEHQASGFAYELEIETLLVQNVERAVDRNAQRQMIADLKVKAANAYASAARLGELLAALTLPDPAPVAPPAADEPTKPELVAE